MAEVSTGWLAIASPPDAHRRSWQAYEPRSGFTGEGATEAEALAALRDLLSRAGGPDRLPRGHLRRLAA